MAIFRYTKPTESLKIEPKIEKEPDAWDKIVAESKSETKDITDGYNPYPQFIDYLPITLNVDFVDDSVKQFEFRLAQYYKDIALEKKIGIYPIQDIVKVSVEEYLEILKHSKPTKLDYTKLPEIIKPELVIKKFK